MPRRFCQLSEDAARLFYEILARISPGIEKNSRYRKPLEPAGCFINTTLKKFQRWNFISTLNAQFNVEKFLSHKRNIFNVEKSLQHWTTFTMLKVTSANEEAETRDEIFCYDNQALTMSEWNTVDAVLHLEQGWATAAFRGMMWAREK